VRRAYFTLALVVTLYAIDLFAMYYRKQASPIEPEHLIAISFALMLGLSWRSRFYIEQYNPIWTKFFKVIVTLSVWGTITFGYILLNIMIYEGYNLWS
jgi:hypothetical protein